jgi:hypothetical protein
MSFIRGFHPVGSASFFEPSAAIAEGRQEFARADRYGELGRASIMDLGRTARM